ISLTLQAQEYLSKEAPSTPLTEEQVIRFMKTELAVSRLQKNIIAKKGEFDQLEREEIRVFYEKRKPLVESYGWDLNEFEEVRNRVFDARSTIEQYEDVKKEEQNYQKKVAENAYDQQEKENQKIYQDMINQIKQNEYLSEQQKTEMVKQITAMQNRTK